MDIQSWFDRKGSFAEGVKLYSQLSNCSKMTLRSFASENSANFLKLKFELKKAILSGHGKKATEEKIIYPEPQKAKEIEMPSASLQTIIKESADASFQKETMAMYPMELHATYRERIAMFYEACELKFQLNSVQEADEKSAIKIIFQLDDLWTKIDRAWMILDHWKDQGRIMPLKESEDFKKLSGNKLVMMRNNLETRISKRQKTIDTMRINSEASPEDRSLSNLLNRKLEQLHQLIIDLEEIRKILKNE